MPRHLGKDGIVKQYLELTSQYISEYGPKTCVLMQVGSFYEVYGLRFPNGNIVGSVIEQVSSDCDLIIANKKQVIHYGAGPGEAKKPTNDWISEVHLLPDNLKSPDPSEPLLVMMAGFGLPQLNKYAKKLQRLGYTCPVFDQDIQAPNSTRSLSQIISPGTYLDIDTNSLSNIVACLVILDSSIDSKSYDIGYSSYDMISGELTSSELFSDESGRCWLDELEHTVCTKKPHEILLICESHVDPNYVTKYLGLQKSLVHILSSGQDTEMSKLRTNSSKQMFQQHVLGTLFSKTSPNVIQETIRTNELAMQSLCVLCNFLSTHNAVNLAEVSFPLVGQRNDAVRLGNHSLRQLNVVGDPETANLSLMDFFDKCLTKGGRRFYQRRVAYPIHDCIELERRYEIIALLLSDQSRLDSLQKSIKTSCDVSFHLRLLARGTITPRRLAQLALSANLALEICSTHGDLLEPDHTHDELVQSIRPLRDRLYQTIDVEKCLKYSNLVADFSMSKSGCELDPSEIFVVGHSAEVDQARDCLQNEMSKLHALRNDLDLILSSTGEAGSCFERIKIHKTPKSGYSLTTTSRRAKLIESFLISSAGKAFYSKFNDGSPCDPYVEIKAVSGTSKNDKIISSHQIEDLTTSLGSLQDELLVVVRSAFNAFCGELVSFIPLFETINKIISTVDFYQAAATIARLYKLSRPTLQDDGESSYVDVKGLRHPLIEHYCSDEIYVPNDVKLCPGENGMLLYGTNAVGKSSLIKALGISVILAQAGLFVPCSKMRLKPYRRIFTRILGNDDIFRGLSTFAVEMSELRNILVECNGETLVLGDELCSGTESKSAHCIFATGIEWLHNRSSSFIFATHFHEIAKFERIKSLSGLRAFHMKVAYDKEKDTLVYDRKLVEGMGEMMYGLEVCKALGLPGDFLERANVLRQSYSDTPLLRAKQTRYSKRKLKGCCEICGGKGEDIHHILHQSHADSDGFIGEVHKNHPANLMNLCKACHDRVHLEGLKFTRKKTIGGHQVVLEV